MSAWKLIIEDDAGKTIVVPLARDEITIGRKEGNTIRLTERNVSRFHARLQRDNGQVIIHDLESYTGVRINGDRIRGAVEVREGDLIEIGDYHLALQAEGAQQPALAPQQGGGGEQPTVPLHTSTQAPGLVEADDDQFAGDTQRWEPPADMDAPQVGNLPTQESTALADGETARFTVGNDPTLEAPALADGDTHDVTMPGADPLSGPTAAEPAAPGLDPVGDLPTAQMPSLVEPQLAPHDQPTMPAASIPAGPSEESPAAPITLEPVPASPEPLPEQTQAVATAPADETASSRLVVINTVFAGTVLPFDQAEMVLGRTEDNDLILQHKSVSRNHARVTQEGDQYRIHNLGSANGVLVNDEEVADAILKDGDVIELGRVRMRYVPAGVAFALSAAEIERARIADTTGEDLDDPATHVTSPSRAKHTPAKGGPPKVVLAAGVGLIVIVAVVVLLFSGGDDPPDGQAAVVDPPTPIEPAPGTPETTQALIEAAQKHINAGQWAEAVSAAQDAVDAEGGAAAEQVLARAQKGRTAEDTLASAKTSLEEGNLEEAYSSAESVEAVLPSQAETAAKMVDDLRGRLSERLARKAQDAHDTDDKEGREAALEELAEYDGEEAERLRGVFAAEDDSIAVASKEPPSNPPDPVRSRGRKPKPKPKPKPDPKPEEPKEDPGLVAKRVEILLTQATGALLKGQSGQAINALKQARKLAPRNAKIYRTLGQAYEKQGMNKKAAGNYKQYLRLSPGAPDSKTIQKRIKSLD